MVQAKPNLLLEALKEVQHFCRKMAKFYPTAVVGAKVIN